MPFRAAALKEYAAGLPSTGDLLLVGVSSRFSGDGKGLISGERGREGCVTDRTKGEGRKWSEEMIDLVLNTRSKEVPWT